MTARFAVWDAAALVPIVEHADGGASGLDVRATRGGEQWNTIKGRRTTR